MSTDCSMSDVEGSSSDSDVFHNSNAANNRIDNPVQNILENAVQNILDNEAHQVVDNAAHQVVANAAHQVVANAAHQVVANAAHQVVANAAHQVFDNAAHQVFDNAAHQVFDNAAHQVVANAAHQVFDNAAHQVFDNAAHQVFDNAAHQVFDNAAHQVFDNAAHQVFDNAAHQVFDNAAHQVFDNAAHQVFDNAAHQVVDNAAYQVVDNAANNEADGVAFMEVDNEEEASPEFKFESSRSSSKGTSEHIMGEDAVVDNTLSYVMETLGLHRYTSKNQECYVLMACKEFFAKDYVCELVANDNFSVHYPIEVIIPVCKKGENERMEFDGKVYSELVNEASAARLRSGRFVIPTILFDHKFICRSGNLTSFEYAAYEQGRTVTSTAAASIEASSIKEPDVIRRLFVNDVNVLKYWKVKLVCGFMSKGAENYRDEIRDNPIEKAKVCGDLELEELPYPDCEFFRNYSEAERNAKDLHFEWSQSDVAQRLRLTEDAKLLFPEMNIEEFRTWDLIKLTQNYLKILLSYLAAGTGGMVVHCISGSDHTPLFISLLRLSLWADGVVHDSLQPEEMAYLTVAYDWLLFGHNLPERLARKEEIMHFCFNFLEHITSDDFSITKLFENLPPEKKGKRIFPEFVPKRRFVLNRIRAQVLSHL